MGKKTIPSSSLKLLWKEGTPLVLLTSLNHILKVFLQLNNHLWLLCMRKSLPPQVFSKWTVIKTG